MILHKLPTLGLGRYAGYYNSLAHLYFILAILYLVSLEVKIGDRLVLVR
jgi:hypothetical protein